MAGEEPHMLWVIGPPAVGKMTVGAAIARLAGYRLFHNHMTIDLLTPFFAFGTHEFNRLIEAVRIPIFEECAAAGMRVVFTSGWAFDVPADREAVDRYCAPYRKRGHRVSFLELQAPLETRLARNRTEPRLSSKRLDWATDDALGESARLHRLSSDGDFPYPDEHAVIDNTALTAEETARRAIALLRL
jgi:hypothetical protein